MISPPMERQAAPNWRKGGKHGGYREVSRGTAWKCLRGCPGLSLQNFSVGRIQRRFGPFGLRTLVRDARNGRKAPISDNTQMILATIDGILWADAKKLDLVDGIYRGYMRWYYSQTGEEPRRGQRTWMRRQPHEREFCLVRENSCMPAGIRRKAFRCLFQRCERLHESEG